MPRLQFAAPFGGSVFRLSLIVILGLATARQPARAVTIETVPVGDPGNGNDPATGNLYGGVSYAYNIGKYEVTVGEYTEFLNAVATTDTYSLYNAGMATDLNVAGIAQSGGSGSYSYSVIGSPNHPITYVSWGDAARFANWLHNGQPSGAQGPGTTETGAYMLNGATTTPVLMAVTRNVAARWFIPTENESYKAAYFQPAAQGGDSDSYWAYPMRTDSEPYSDQPPGATPDNTRVGNFFGADGYGSGGFAVTGSTSFSSTLNYLTDVGGYSWSTSFYGTFDQGGNVSEWNENAANVSGRALRGGSWTSQSRLLLASNRFVNAPSAELSVIGFRLASVVPEPGTAALLACWAFGAITLRRRRSWSRPTLIVVHKLIDVTTRRTCGAKFPFHVALLLLALVSSTSAAPRYDIVTLGFFDPEHSTINHPRISVAEQLNQAGHVRGIALRGADGGQTAWLYKGTTMINVASRGPNTPAATASNTAIPTN